MVVNAIRRWWRKGNEKAPADAVLFFEHALKSLLRRDLQNVPIFMSLSIIVLICWSFYKIDNGQLGYTPEAQGNRASQIHQNIIDNRRR